MKNLLKGFFSFLSAGKNPSFIAGGICLGIFIGLTPAVNFQSIFLFFILIILNVHLFSMTLSLSIFSCISIYLIDIYDKLGYFLLVELKFLKPLWIFLENNFIFSMTRLNNTVVMGSITIALILLIPIFIITYKISKKIQGHISNLLTKSEKGKLGFIGKILKFLFWSEEKENIIRWKSILLIIIAFFGGSIFYYFGGVNYIAEYTIENLGSEILGTPLDVDKANISLKPAGVNLEKFSIVDPDDYNFNLLSLGNLNGNIEVNPFLSYISIVLPDVKATDINFNSKRDIPFPLNRAPKNKQSLLKKENLVKKIEGLDSPIDFSKLKNFSEKDIEKILKDENLKSPKLLREYQEKIKTQEKNIKEYLQNVPTDKEIKEIRKEIENIRAERNRNPQQILKLVQKLKNFREKLSSYNKEIMRAEKNIRKELEYVNVDKFKEALEHDSEYLSNKYGISKDGLKNFAAMLINKEYIKKIEKIINLYEKIKFYIIPKTKVVEKKDDVNINPAIWQNGKNVYFNSKAPGFWLKNFVISVKDQNIKFREDSYLAKSLSLQIKDLSSSPLLIEKDLFFSLDMQLEKAKFKKLNIEGNINYQKEKNDIKFKISNYKMEGAKLGKGGLIIDFTSGEADFIGQILEEKNVKNFKLKLSIPTPQLQLNNSSDIWENLAKKVFSRSKKLDLFTYIKIKEGELDISFKSNLDNIASNMLKDLADNNISNIHNKINSALKGNYLTKLNILKTSEENNKANAKNILNNRKNSISILENSISKTIKEKQSFKNIKKFRDFFKQKQDKIRLKQGL